MPTSLVIVADCQTASLNVGSLLMRTADWNATHSIPYGDCVASYWWTLILKWYSRRRVDGASVNERSERCPCGFY